MQQDNAQPSAAYALPRKRNVELSDATKTLRSPQRRTHCQENEFLGNRMQQDNAQPSAAHALLRKRNVGLSDATKTLRSPQLRTHCQENEIAGQSDATAQPSAAYALP